MMLRKLVLLFLILLGVVVVFLTWKITGSNTAFKEEQYFLYIKTGSSFGDLMQTLQEDRVIHNAGIFSFVAKKLNLPRKIKAGKYEIKKGAGIWSIVQMLRSGKQSPVNLVITRLRTKEDFARLAGRRLECDSAAIMSYLNNTDSLQSKGLDTNTVMTVIIPDTYTFFWNTSVDGLFSRLIREEKKFWNDTRRQKAENIGLTPQQVYILASVIEEETNKHDEMPLMASVYINRLNKGMPLGADPTVKFATRDFAAKRVTLKMISQSAASPYNTYRNKGLPPGPICTPSVKTIDATLDAASTGYLYFCAKPDFSGYHVFAVTDTEHFRNARAYQKALDRLKIK